MSLGRLPPPPAPPGRPEHSWLSDALRLPGPAAAAAAAAAVRRGRPAGAQGRSMRRPVPVSGGAPRLPPRLSLPAESSRRSGVSSGAEAGNGK